MMTKALPAKDPLNGDWNASGRLRVIHAVLSLDCGGLEHVVLDLARAGRASGQDVSVICLERPGTLAAQLEREGMSVHCLDKPQGLGIALMWRRLRAAFHKLRPDILHTHQIGPLFYVGIVARALGLSVVHTEHGRQYDEQAKRRWLGRIAAWHAERFFCVSADIAAEVIRRGVVPARKVSVVPNGINVELFRKADGNAVRRELGIPAEAPVLGTIGRMADEKRQDLLIRAFCGVLERLPEAHLVLVGDGPLRGILQRLAVERRVTHQTHFTGYRADRERLLQAMDVFTLTSRSEGMPLSVLEAWAARLPVVAARVGGLPELINDGKTGVLVEGDDPARWATAFTKLLMDKEHARRLGENGHAVTIERYALEVMQRAYESHYRAVLAAKRGAGCGTKAFP